MVRAWITHCPNAFDQIRAMLDEPLAASLEVRVAVKRVSRHSRRAKDGNEADHCAGANGHWLVLPGDQVVVEKTILLSPERLTRVAFAVHGISDENVVLPEFAGDILVGRILFCKQKRE